MTWRIRLFGRSNSIETNERTNEQNEERSAIHE